MSAGDGRDLPGPLEPAAQQSTMPEFAGYVVNAGPAGELLGSVVRSMFHVGGLLQDAADLPQDVRRLRIAEALRWLEDLAGQIRDHVFTQSGQQTRPGSARRRLPDRSALLKERAAQTARALQAAAADAAVLLEQQADLARQPGRMDYPTEIKRWRAFADQAEQMAKRWEQPP